MTSGSKSPVAYFVLVFLLALPFWWLGAVREEWLPRGVTFNLPISALMFVCPFIAASILVYREQRWGGVKRLWQRAVDFPRIGRRVWWLPLLLLMPLFMLLEYGWQKLQGVPIPPIQLTALTPLLFLIFLITGLAEEIGWSGYTVDPLQKRWGAFPASIMVGTVWAVWHIVPYLQAQNPAGWIVWQCAGTVANRVLIVWLYNNTGTSVFAAGLFHAMYNLCFLVLFPVYGSYDDPFTSAVLFIAAAVIVTTLWGPATLARYRYASRAID